MNDSFGNCRWELVREAAYPEQLRPLFFVSSYALKDAYGA
jgi:hypothetical protein